MTEAEFTATLVAPAPPTAWSALLRALWYERRGDWHAAHELAQADETNPLANWLHAYLHRREGDLSNAGYWYRRAGQPQFIGTEAEEWTALLQAALQEVKPKN